MTLQNCRLRPVQVRSGEKEATAAGHSGLSLDKVYTHEEGRQREMNTEGRGSWGPRKGNVRRGEDLGEEQARGLQGQGMKGEGSVLYPLRDFQRYGLL